jgi:adenylate kinase family enzyme
VKRVLITGMSGTGKSSTIAELTARGYKAVDTDWDPEWEVMGGDGEWTWREDRIQSLLDQEDSDYLFISACVSNQGRFYGRFDQIILLSAPRSTMVQRLANRTNNPYGKRTEDVTEVLSYTETIEPLLRRSATAEIVTSIPLSDVVDQIVDLTQRP